MSTAQLDDMTCHYEATGAGRPLLLLAGLASDCGSWAPVDRMLAEHFSVITYDQRGVGRTTCPEGPFTVANLADDAVRLLDDLGINRAALLGHSMGGFVAMSLALRHPDRVERLVLAATAASCSPGNRVLFFRLVDMRESGVPFGAFLCHFFSHLFTPAFLDQPDKVLAMRDAVLAYPYRQTDAGFRRQVEAAADFSVEKDLHLISAPTTIIAGRHDILMTEAETEHLARSIPGAQLVVLESAAHALFAENPIPFVDAVLQAMS